MEVGCLRLPVPVYNVPRCKNLWSFSCFVAIVMVRVYYVDFFVFFVNVTGECCRFLHQGWAHPGCSTIASQLLSGDYSHCWKIWKPEPWAQDIPSLRTSKQSYCMVGERGAHGQVNPAPWEKSPNPAGTPTSSMGIADQIAISWKCHAMPGLNTVYLKPWVSMCHTCETY